MRAESVWTAASVSGMLVLGLAGGLVVAARGSLSAFGFASAFFVAIFVSSALALQLYRRSLGAPVLVGAVAGGVSMLAFVAAPLWIHRGPGLDLQGAAILLSVAPLAAGAFSAGGTLFLARGVDQYRARHGSRHAPK